MPITARIDEFGKPAWIALTVVGFFVWWPVGLVTLAFALGSGRMGCGNHGRHWGHERSGQERWGGKMERMQEKMDRMRQRASGGGFWGPPSSGNRAFDEYRTDTIKRLEEEQREFQEFLHRLRFARDKAEFDQFMADRRNQPQPGAPQGQPPQGQPPQGWQQDRNPNA